MGGRRTYVDISKYLQICEVGFLEVHNLNTSTQKRECIFKKSKKVYMVYEWLLIMWLNSSSSFPFSPDRQHVASRQVLQQLRHFPNILAIIPKAAKVKHDIWTQTSHQRSSFGKDWIGWSFVLLLYHSSVTGKNVKCKHEKENDMKVFLRCQT